MMRIAAMMHCSTLLLCTLVALALLQHSYGAECVKQYPILSESELPSGFLADAIEEVDDILSSWYNNGDGGTTAYVYSIFYGDTVLKYGGGGVTNHDTSTPVDEHTKFRIQSVTKVVTALTMLSLRDQGLLRIDVPAAEHLPELLDVPNRFASPSGPVDFTLEDLSKHAAGLPTSAPCMSHDDDADDPIAKSRSCNVTYAEIVDRWAHEGGPIMPPNYQPLYSNFGMGLLGNALGRSQGARVDEALDKYKSLVHKLVLDPLEMNDTGFDVDSPEVQESIAYAYTNEGEKVPQIAKVFYAPSHGLYSSVSDITKLGQAMFRTGAPRIDSSSGCVVKGSSMRAAMMPSAYWQQLPGEFYDAWGMGWRVRGEPTNNNPFGNMVMKFGYNTAKYESFVGGYPSLGIGMAFIKTNGPPITDRLSMWYALDALAKVLAPATLAEMQNIVPQNTAPPSDFPSEFLGKYMIHNVSEVPFPVGPITISMDDEGILEAELPSFEPFPVHGKVAVSFIDVVVDENGMRRYLFALPIGDQCSIHNTDWELVSLMQQGECVALLVPYLSADVTGLKVGSPRDCSWTIPL